MTMQEIVGAAARRALRRRARVLAGRLESWIEQGPTTTSSRSSSSRSTRLIASRPSAIVLDAFSVIANCSIRMAGGNQGPDPLDPEVVGLTQYHSALSALIGNGLRLQNSVGA